MKNPRIPLKGGEEHDVFNKKARKIYCYTSRAGVCKSIKKRYNKRLRKYLKNKLVD